jgi:diguanylate cyclase (GGDEF)-like protein
MEGSAPCLAGPSESMIFMQTLSWQGPLALAGEHGPVLAVLAASDGKVLLQAIVAALLAFFAGMGLAAWVLLRRTKVLAEENEVLEEKLDSLSLDLETTNHALAEAKVALASQSLLDPLTMLHNRRFLSVVIDNDVAKTLRVYRANGPELQPNQDLVFFMVDLDHFSRINEYYGHQVGDQVLQMGSKILRGSFRETDAIIRWGGEEFLILARNTSRAQAPALAERVRSLMSIQSLVLQSGEVVRWTCSVGFTAFPFQPKDLAWLTWDRVVELADACLDMAKQSGRNSWVGIQARQGLDRAQHGSRLPWEIKNLAEEGVLDVFSSRRDPYAKTIRVGVNLG